MGHSKSKLSILALPAQSGKTRKAEEMIQFLNQTKSLLGEPNDINIWISANNQTLVAQTDTRIRKDLGAKTYSWMSSAEEKLGVDALVYRIISKKIDTVVMCAHTKRVAHYFSSLMEELSNSEFFAQKVNIWMDEADRFLPLWDKCKTLIHLPCVQHCVFITATPETIIGKYGSINISPYEFTYGEHYRRLANCERIELDIIGASPVAYLSEAITQFPEILTPGSRFFAPGSFERKSHEEIAESLIGLGVAVLILNGEYKEIRVPNNPDHSQQDMFHDKFVFDEEKGIWILDLKEYLSDRTKELNQIISKVYQDNCLNQYPFAITGYLCVQRGITFQALPEKRKFTLRSKEVWLLVHEGFLLDYAIIPEMSNRDEVYQTVSRAFGNVGNHPSYKPCTIISTPGNFKRITHQEELVVNLARIANDMKQPGQQMVEINKEHIKLATFDVSAQSKYGLTDLFDDEKQLDAFLEDHLLEGKITHYRRSAKNTIQYRGETIPLHVFESIETFRIKDLYSAINTTISARCMPVVYEGAIKWIGVYLKSSFNI